MKVDIDKARAVAVRRAQRYNYSIELPNSTRREAALYGLAAVHKLRGGGWDLAYAREHVSITLPGLGTTAAKLLSALPVVGSLLLACCTERTSVFYSRASWDAGPVLMGTIFHEEGHVGDIAAGGLAWCLGYGLLDEVRAAGEAPCYGASMAAEVRLNGRSPEEAAHYALEALGHYDLGPAAMELARAQVAFHRATLEQPQGDPGGIVAEMLASLAEVV